MKLRSIFGGVILAIGVLFFMSVPTFAVPPQYFQSTLVIGAGLDGPSGFEIAPDGRIFILQRTGEIKIYKNGQLLAQNFAVLPSVATGDRGLIGIAFDPQFVTNHFVYFYYTGLDLLNRLVRFDASGDVGTNGPVILYQTTFESNQLHVGGSIRFGPDGKIYFAVGDNGYPPNGQDLTNPHGKILRINKDGTIPSDNPFFGQTGKLPEIWAYGFRNPWRFQFDSVTGEIYGGDVGDFTIEEVNHIVKGGNYGWPTSEGPCTGCGFINPIYWYPHNGASSAVTGGPVYRASMFPQDYYGSLFFGDYAQGFIKRIKLDANGNSAGVFDFDLNAGSVVDLKVAPDGSMYYLTYIPGRLYRISYSTTNQVPVASATADVTKGVDPLTVHFSSNGSYDPDNNPLTFAWNFGDGTQSTDANPIKVFNTKGTYIVQLVVSDGTNQALAVPITIQVGIPPTVTIGQPKNGTLYKAGDVINYTASAVDGAGFDINDGSIVTNVLFHHGTHIHPFLGPVIGRTGQFTIPTTGEASADTWFEILVTATDTNGLATTASVSIYPIKSSFTLASVISGLQLLLDGSPITTPITIQGVVGFLREVTAPILQIVNNVAYQFDHWSDNSAIKHIFAVPPTDTTYTAFYNQANPFTGQYYNNTNLTGTPVLTRSDPTIQFIWNDGSPDPVIATDNFSVRWVGTQKFPYGRYKFTTSTDDGVRLYIDGTLKIDQWHDQGTTDYTSIVDLAAGTHEIKMEYYEKTGGAIAKLFWELTPDQPVSASPSPSPSPSTVPSPSPVPGAFSGEYFTNQTLSGTPALTRNDPAINFVWDNGSPDPAIPADHFSVRWTKQKNYAAGTYSFTLKSDDGIRFWIDNQLLVDDWNDHAMKTDTVTTAITAGLHTLKIEYYENSGGALAILQEQ